MEKIIIFFIAFSILINGENKKKYTLKKSFEVAGRQGIAVDKNYYYVSGSKSIYKYSKDGKLVAKNINPFKNYTVTANHIGDIDVYNNEIFVSAEYFMDGVAMISKLQSTMRKLSFSKELLTLNPNQDKKKLVASVLIVNIKQYGCALG